MTNSNDHIDWHNEYKKMKKFAIIVSLAAVTIGDVIGHISEKQSMEDKYTLINKDGSIDKHKFDKKKTFFQYLHDKWIP